jgi:UDP-N-acetylmuramoyl-L-alanyl-D-glutamate--2,6-diaminopimelate ligase
MLKSRLRALVPEPLLNLYHLSLAHLAAIVYGNPSEELIVIGVTGTNGKSSTVQFLGRILEHAGHRVGWTTTVSFKVADREWVNDRKMTMLGRFATQRLLRDMVRAGCTHAVVETSSQGVAQSRHVGINYDVAVFTNLTPEHIEAHGGFENYKRAKGAFFQHVSNSARKRLNGEEREKVSVVNIDDPHAPYFLSFRMDRQYGFGVEGRARTPEVVPYLATDVSHSGECTTFTLAERTFHFKPIGRFNFFNALAAATTAHALGIDWSTIADAVGRLTGVPGRLERIDEGQPFAVIVDYAYEPASLNAVYEALRLVPRNRLIHVVGSAGGGRDVARREVLGRMAAETDDIVIVTNEDPYDEDPQAIIDQVAHAAVAAGKIENRDLFRILDRREAIARAVRLAQPGDLVLLTGKGCEPVMAVADGKKVPWDDRSEARRALHAL